MAIVGTNYAGAESKWAWVEEATFGTAIVDTANYSMFECTIPTGIDYGMVRSLDVKNDGSRMASDANVYYNQTGGLRVIPFSDMIVRKTDLGVLLYLVTQNVSEAATTPYTKTFTLTNTTTQPDFTANAGMFATIGIKDPIASNHRKFTSCILKTLTLTADLRSSDPRLKASGEFISGFANSATANFATGTWAYATQAYFNMRALTTKQIGGTDIVLYGFTFTFNNNAVIMGCNTTGYAESYAVGVPEWEVTGELITKYDSVTDGLIANSIAGTGSKIQIATGTAAADGHFDFTANIGHYTGNPDKDYGAPEGQTITFPFKALYNVSPGAAGVVVTVSDATDRTW
jgi:hypothetical protein